MRSRRRRASTGATPDEEIATISGDLSTIDGTRGNQAQACERQTNRCAADQQQGKIASGSIIEDQQVADDLAAWRTISVKVNCEFEGRE